MSLQIGKETPDFTAEAYHQGEMTQIRLSDFRGKWILLFLGFIIILSFMQFLLNIHPPRYIDPDRPENHNLKYENVSFETSDKITIRAWLIESKKANGTIIIGHGYPFNKGNILPVVKFLYPKYNLLLYDHRYFGES